MTELNSNLVVLSSLAHNLFPSANFEFDCQESLFFVGSVDNFFNQYHDQTFFSVSTVVVILKLCNLQCKI